MSDQLLKNIQDFEIRYDPKELEIAQQLHQEFLHIFPKEQLQNLTIEQYALGKTPSGSLSWWMEYNTIPLGSIKGGSASKHIIYFSKKEGDWKFPGGWKSVQEAWQQLRSDMVELVSLYDNGASGDISADSMLYRANMVKGKLLYLYHSDRFLPIYLLDHLQTFLTALDVPKDLWAGKDNLHCNLLLRRTLNSIELLKEWHPVKLKEFLYEAYLPEEKYFKISPGKEAALWPQCLESGTISVGWDEMGDLTQYPDYEEFKNAFQSQGYQETPNKNTEKANELWQFYNLKPGDQVIANKGKSQILAIGTVTGQGYAFKDELDSHKHTVHVIWDTVYEPPLDIPQQDYWPMKTVYELTKKQVTEWKNGSSGSKGQQATTPATYTPEDEQFFNKLEQALARKGQCILYGPPGTGKTYMARRYIAWKHEKEKILSSEAGSGPKVWMMIAAEKEFQWETILDNGGSMDWGLRSVKKNFYNARKGELILCYKGHSKENGFIGVAEVDRPFDGEKLRVRGIRSFKEAIPFEDFKNVSEYLNTPAGRINNRGTLFEITEEFAEWLRDYLLEAGDEGAAAILDKSGVQNVEICTFHPSFNYEDFIEGYKPVSGENGTVAFQLEKGIFTRLCEKAQENPNRPYFLIIDELNRGNVPKIFGEIITLLEKDKRGMELRLPQSKDSFSIPENLHIIATMNTSDRSIKMMDAALKRRFAFIECMPQYELLKQDIENLGLSSGKILQALNEALVKFQGRDKQIGHAYFMKKGEALSSLSDLKEVYELEIIPLIQEYCFDNYELLADIVGKGFVDAANMEVRSELFMEHNDAFAAELIKQFKG